MAFIVTGQMGLLQGARYGAAIAVLRHTLFVKDILKKGSAKLLDKLAMLFPTLATVVG